MSSDPRYVWEVMGVTAGKAYRTLVEGLPGTGKSKFYQLWGEKHDFNVMSVTMTPETQPSELIGSFGIQGGDFVWLDAIVAKAWRDSHEKPTIVVINEIDHTGGAAMSTLQGILDDVDIARMDLPTGEVLRPKAGNLFYVATMNGNADELPSAIRDRFPVLYTVECPNPEAVAGLPAELQDVAFNTSTLVDENRRLSVRIWYAFVELTKQGIDEEVAAYAILGSRGPELIDALKIARNGS